MSADKQQLQLVSAVTTIVAIATTSEERREWPAEITTVPSTHGGRYETTAGGELPLTPFVRLPADSFRQALRHHAALIMPVAFGREFSRSTLRAASVVEFRTPDLRVHTLTLTLLDRVVQAALGERKHDWAPQGSAWLDVAHFANRLGIFANTRTGAWPSAW